MPEKLYAAGDNNVQEPKLNMRTESTLEGLNFLPNMAIGGAKIT